jgi:hypothetical protein
MSTAEALHLRWSIAQQRLSGDQSVSPQRFGLQAREVLNSIEKKLRG